MAGKRLLMMGWAQGAGVLVAAWALTFATASQALTETKCDVESSHIPVTSISLSPLEDNEVNVTFEMDEDTVISVCDLQNENSMTTTVVCTDKASTIVLTIRSGSKSQIDMEATSPEGEILKVPTGDMSCN